MKKCCVCKAVKVETDFHLHRGRKDGRQTFCKDCVAMRHVSRRELDRAYNRAWQVANPERVNEHNRAWAKANPEKVRAAARRYSKIKSEKFAAKEATKRALKFKATPLWADRKAMAEVYKEAKYFGYQVDHVVPLKSETVCALHVWDNLQLISKVENLMKGNRVWPDMPQ